MCSRVQGEILELFQITDEIKIPLAFSQFHTKRSRNWAFDWAAQFSSHILLAAQVPPNSQNTNDYTVCLQRPAQTSNVTDAQVCECFWWLPAAATQC